MVSVALLISACSDKDVPATQVYTLHGDTMGTNWSVHLHSTSADLAALEEALLVELARINDLMSTWNPDSQLSRFNQWDSVEPVTLHPDTLSVIDTAQRISWLTDGRYDITLKPVIELWGFGSEPARTNPSIPELAEAMKLAGPHMLVRIGETLRKRHPRVSVDVSSLGKGFAVDQLGRVLESFNVNNYLVDIGGELRARGQAVNTQPWRVGIEQPDGGVAAGLLLQDSHVASSGSYRNYREENGKRLSHIIDGQTGEPIEHAVVAVSVVHDSTMLADAWATALLVVGEATARELIQQQMLAAQLTLRANDEFVVYRSPAFSSLLLESS